MKKLFRIALVLTLTLVSSSAFAQKFGRINMQELIAGMPETKDMQTNMETYRKDLLDQLESIQVEFNNKLNDYQKSAGTLSDAVKQLKEKELQDLQNRYQEFEQVAQQDMQKKQNELLAPIIKRAQDAVKSVSKAAGYLAVFDVSSGSIAYFDESNVTDIAPQVQSELAKTTKSTTTTPAAVKSTKPAPAKKK